jgi:hypothetical protein
METSPLNGIHAVAVSRAKFGGSVITSDEEIDGEAF